MKNLRLLLVAAVLLVSNSAYSAVPVTESGGSYLTVAVNHKYKLFNNPRTYTTAKTACKNVNAHLAIISSASEAAVSKTLLSALNGGAGGSAWYGLERAAGSVPGTYVPVVPADLYFGSEITPFYRSFTVADDVTGLSFNWDNANSSALVMYVSDAEFANGHEGVLSAAFTSQTTLLPFVCEWDQY